MSSTVDDPLSPPPEPPILKKTTSGSSDSSVSSGVDASIGSCAASDGDNRSSSTNISLHDLSKEEANHYYAGIRYGGGGPKLIYRTSRDKFAFPVGPETQRSFVSFCPVPSKHSISEVGVWDAIRPAIIEVLDKHNVYWISVDLVCFCWDAYGEEEQDLVETLHTTNPTIWVAIAPDSLTGDLAHDCATAILALAHRRQIIDIDIAFRESGFNLLAGPLLLPPATDAD